MNGLYELAHMNLFRSRIKLSDIEREELTNEEPEESNDFDSETEQGMEESVD